MFKLEIYSHRNREKGGFHPKIPPNISFRRSRRPIRSNLRAPSLQETPTGVLGRVIAFGSTAVACKLSENDRNQCGSQNSTNFHIFRAHYAHADHWSYQNPFQRPQSTYWHPYWSSIVLGSTGIAPVDLEIQIQTWNSSNWHLLCLYRWAYLTTRPSIITTEATKNSDNTLGTHLEL